jgi:hypothetical protein
VEPQPSGTLGALEVAERVVGGTVDPLRAHRRQVEGKQVRRERPAAFGGGGLGVAEPKRDHVVVAQQRPTTLEVGEEFGAAARHQRQVQGRRLARGLGPRLVEVGVPVEEEQAVAPAPSQRERAPEQELQSPPSTIANSPRSSTAPTASASRSE